MTIAVKRALSLLDLFSETTPEIGLSEISRRAEQDKATVHRLLNTLREAGLVEQHPGTKLYRLGAGVLHLARAREAAFPVIAVVQPMLDHLTLITGETTHCSLYTNATLAVIATVESRKANRVSMRGSETLPFHATASGIAFLAFASAEVSAKAYALPMTAYTSKTYTTLGSVHAAVADARRLGYASVDKAFEDDVYGIAAPVFGPDQTAIGAIAVATPCHRMTPELERLIIAAVQEAAVDLTRKLGNEPPTAHLAC